MLASRLIKRPIFVLKNFNINQFVKGYSLDKFDLNYIKKIVHLFVIYLEGIGLTI